jgi:hypothetical protein
VDNIGHVSIVDIAKVFNGMELIAVGVTGVLFVLLGDIERHLFLNLGLHKGTKFLGGTFLGFF